MLLSETEDHAVSDINRRVRDQALRSRRPCARGEVLCAEPGRSRECPTCVIGPVSEGASRTRSMNVHEKSDTAIVPKKVSNNGGLHPAERLEGRAVLKWNVQPPAAVRTQSRGTASIGLLAVRRAAQRRKNLKFTALMHHIDIELLRQSYFKLKRDAASGIDGVDWASYGEGLNERLELLHKRVQQGSYRAQPARRVHIPKADGSLRPLSILCIEDKIVQQAVVEVLQAIYEPDFMGFSYGFRPERGQHDALDALQTALYRKQVNWILDADIRKFFDSMDHTWTLRFLQHRIGDRRLLRLIRKWLKVGIMEKGSRVLQEVGVPQGAVVSPILANVYLHHVFDLWVHHWRRQNAKGDVIVIRYADDTVLGFQHKRDADSLLEALKSRLSGFGLALHPDKTRLLEFGRYAQERRAKAGKGKPETFDFLGFTHYCSRARNNGWFKVERKTIAKRMRAQLQVIKTELRRRLHRPIDETGRWINQVLRGHMAYYAVPGNGPSITSFVYRVEWLWLRSLCRRSQRRRMKWERFKIILNRYVPRVRIMHPQPLHRFDAKHTREEPSALGAHAGICAGGAG